MPTLHCEIIVVAPEVSCKKCERSALLRPVHLHSAAGKNVPGFRAADGEGRPWAVLAADRPEGWVAYPAGSTDITSGLCAECAAAWRETVGEFFGEAAVAPPPVELRGAPTTAQPIAYAGLEAAAAMVAPQGTPMGPYRKVGQPVTVESIPQPAPSRAPGPQATPIAAPPHTGVRTTIAQPVLAAQPSVVRPSVQAGTATSRVTVSAPIAPAAARQPQTIPQPAAATQRTSVVAPVVAAAPREPVRNAEPAAATQRVQVTQPILPATERAPEPIPVPAEQSIIKVSAGQVVLPAQRNPT